MTEMKSSTVQYIPKDDEEVIKAEGYLYTRGLFNRWIKRYYELRGNTIFYSVLKNGIKYGHVTLNSMTKCEDNSIRHFCFAITDANGDTKYFAAENIANKEIWTDAIQTTISLLRLAEKKQRNSVDTKSAQLVINEFINRPKIYVKIISARNLLAKDIGKTSDPYVKIIVGTSTARTTTRKKNLNPDWGMVFTFDWERTTRFVKIEVWDEDFSSSDDFLGSVIIPVYSMREGESFKNWYILGKRSQKSNVEGTIEVEITCSGQPDPSLHAWNFFRQIQKLPEFTLNLASSVDGNGQIALRNFEIDHTSQVDGNKSDKTTDETEENSITYSDISDSHSKSLFGFPLYFPSIELERLEDISLRVALFSTVNATRASSMGVLMLTNYRLLFVSNIRIFKLDSETGLTLQSENEFVLKPSQNLDLTTQIPISNIVNISLTTEVEFPGSNVSYDAIKLKSADSRQISFLFKDDIDPSGNSDNPNFGFKNNRFISKVLDNIFERKKSSDTAKTYNFNKQSSVDIPIDEQSEVRQSDNSEVSLSSNASSSLKARKVSIFGMTKQAPDSYLNSNNSMSELVQNWIKLMKNYRREEALDSDEGPPAHRIHKRIKFRIINRHREKAELINIHGPILNAIRRACGMEPTFSEFQYKNSSYSANISTIGISNAENNYSVDTINPAHLPLGWVSNNDEVKSERKIFQNEILRNLSTIEKMENKIAQSDTLINTFTKLLYNFESSMTIYDPLLEFKRLGVPNDQWRISDINRNYSLCSTYPAVLAFPKSVDDNVLFGSATFRSKGRIPTLSWVHPINKCTICRSSQPLIGLANNRNVEDELLISEINKSSSKKSEFSNEDPSIESQSTFVIIDARPILNAKANQAAGKGVESDKVYSNVSVKFMDIANIHAVRKSLEILEDSCNDEANWIKNLESSGWLLHLRKILLAAGKIVHLLNHENLSVLVHCSDGWDRTAQLTSLSMLLLDDYYRTLQGFIVLIEKEWLSFGHKFGDRFGWTFDGWKDEERSPIFIQFLDCVHQIMNQMPYVFEFNQTLLLFIMEHLYSGWFGNFLFNSENERKFYSSQGSIISIWTYVLGQSHLFINESYIQHKQPIIPVVTKSRLVVWSEWFFRWHDKIWSLSWLDSKQLDPKKKDASLRAGWVNNREVKRCATCNRNFSLFRRKHHCRCCGNIFCDNCTRNLRVIPTISKWRPMRCCKDCARNIDLSDMDSYLSTADDESFSQFYEE